MIENKKKRCSWCGNDPLLIKYHDEEWGNINHDDKTHYANLIMEAMQCGLSWRTVLTKRSIIRKCFANFNYDEVAKFNEDNVNVILETEGMIKSKNKIKAIIDNTKVFNQIRKDFGSFDNYIWSFTKGKVLLFEDNTITKCKTSEEISKDLKKRGCKYIGPVVIFSHMQAMGLVQAHDHQCHKYKEFIQSSLKVNLTIIPKSS